MAETPSSDLIALPSGGGALRGVGDTFQIDPHTGAGSFAIPLQLPPGRGALTPSLSLSYGSTSGNGPFGLGWQLGLPAIRRRTDKRVPAYDSADTFTLSGAEDLVPVPGATTPDAPRYRPRTEGPFARIEHVTAGTDHWLVRDKNGTVSTYGTPRPADAGADWRDPAVIADPDRPEHVLAWLLTRTEDPLGNHLAYRYAPDPARPDDPQRYLDQVAYADHGDRTAPSYLVQVRLQYEPRPDVHTDRRAGFTVTTGQRCHSIDTWITTDAEQLVRTVALGYSDDTGRAGDNGVSLLTRVTVTGHDGADTETLPPLSLDYSAWAPAARRFERVTGAPAALLSLPSMDLVDVYGTGLPDVLQLDGATARCWRNTGDASFDPPHTLGAAPAGLALGTPGVQLLDADGDGRPDLLVGGPELAGYFPLAGPAGFDPHGFVRTGATPTLATADGQTRLVDLDGDGVPDALRLGTTVEVALYRPRDGWVSQPIPVGSPLDGLSFTDPRVRLADMTGDGLTDIVLVANGRVQYWPNLGYGRFGDPVTMTSAPHFADADRWGPTDFDPARLLLGDVDGDGCADLLYIGANQLTVWVNRTGTGFAPPLVIRGTPRTDSLTAARLVDLHGTGTAGVLWDCQSAAGGDTYFLDLTGGSKPYLLTGIDNGAGGQTGITYRTSTAYAMDDLAGGRPWRTTLPFPVQVVASLTSTDAFSGTTATTAYRYHHGYWDGADREFRGFASVEQVDTSSVTAADGLPAEHYNPPVLRRTWFHLGPVGSADAWHELDLTDEHWPGDPGLLGPGSRAGLPALAPRQLREAVRALRGNPLRVELYGLDDSPAAACPYTVTEHAYDLLPVTDTADGTADPDWRAQPVVWAAAAASRTTAWERGTDPHTTATFTLSFDRYGNPLQLLDTAVPRGRDPRTPAPGTDAEPILGLLTTTGHAVRDDPSAYFADRVATSTRHELADDGGGPLTGVRDAAAAGTLPTRLLTHTVTHYDGPPHTGLPAGAVGDYGLPKATERLALTVGTLATAWPDPTHAPYLRQAPLSPATGLTGQYFRDAALTTPAFTRCDPTVDLHHVGGPDPALCQPAWSARWTGRLTPRLAGSHTLTLTATGGARLLLDGQAVIDLWATGGTGSAAVPLDPATGHALTVEYRATGWTAALQLSWTPPQATPEVVPTDRLTPMPADPVNWSVDYPEAFRAQLPDTAGYRYHPGDAAHPPGYYVTTGTAHDIDTDPAGRGLVTATRDPFGRDTAIGYDPYQLRPATVTDATGLTTTATYDYRTLQPREVVDPNGNVSHAGYTPLGLPAWTARLGRPGEQQGDTDDQPAVTYQYGLTPAAGPDGGGQPLWVHTTRRVLHRWTVVQDAQAAQAAAGQPPLTDAQIAALFPPDEPTAHPERFTQSRTYLDGSGRALQTRGPADPTVLDDLGLPTDVDQPAGPLQLHTAAPTEQPVLVTGPTAYDNKGHVIKTWEPYRDTGWAWVPPTDSQRTDLACTTTYYDPCGRIVRTVHPDGSTDSTVFGVPAQPLTGPDPATPTPWESYHYDRNDNAGRTDPAGSSGWSTHWNTPRSARLDPRGREVAVTEHLPDGPLTATRSYDTDGRLTALVDPLGRTVATYQYDQLGRAITTTLLDTGATRTVYDATGKAIEQRDAKGALTLAAFDALGRQTRGWAADTAAGPTTLRTVVLYGESSDAGLSADQARAGNLLGRPARQYDEAGALTFTGYDLDGLLLESTRLLLSLDTLRSSSPAPYTVDWQPTAGQTLTDHAAALVDPTPFTTTTGWDALGRRRSCTRPLDAEGHRRQLAYTYAPDGQLRSIGVDGTPYLQRAVHNPRGQRVAAWFGNGVLTRRAYDPATFALTRQHSAPARRTAGADGGEVFTPAGPTLQDEGYRYDLVGNVLTLADRTPGSGLPGATPDALDHSFTYDPRYRLTTATGREHQTPLPDIWSAAPRGTDATATIGYAESYAYDAVGNLLTLTHRSGPAGWTRTATLADGSNRIAQLNTGPTTYTYDHDPCGNLTAEGDSRHFTWNAHNQLAGFHVQPTPDSPPSLTAQYRYASDGSRIGKLVVKQDGSCELTITLEGFERLVLVAPDGTATQHDELHVSDDTGHVAIVRVGPPLPDDQRPAVGYPLADRLGSNVAVIDTTGALVNREEYTPYGETSFGSYARKRYRYTGKERDEESGLTRHGARYYAPWLARWTSCDPAGHVDAFSLYVYVQDNPLCLVDPEGHASTKPKTSGTAKKPVKSVQENQGGAYKDISGSKINGTDPIHAEHGMPGAQLKEALLDKTTGVSDYGPEQYQNDFTFANPLDRAMAKTHQDGAVPSDNNRTRAIKLKGNAAARGEGPGISVNEDIAVPSIEKMVETGTPRSVANNAILEQLGNLFARFNLEETGARVAAYAERAASSLGETTVALAPNVVLAGWMALHEHLNDRTNELLAKPPSTLTPPELHFLQTGGWTLTKDATGGTQWNYDPSFSQRLSDKLYLFMRLPDIINRQMQAEHNSPFA